MQGNREVTVTKCGKVFIAHYNGAKAKGTTIHSAVARAVKKAEKDENRQTSAVA